MPTLWETAERKPCSYCGRNLKVYRLYDAVGAEGTLKAPVGPIDEDYINPEFPEYETVCTKCLGEDIDFKYRKATHERYESKGKPIPKWIWGE